MKQIFKEMFWWVIAVTNDLFGKFNTQFDQLEKKMAKLESKSHKLVAEFLEQTDKQVLFEAFDVVDRCGDICEKKQARDLKKKHDSGIQLDFNDLTLLNKLYKSSSNNSEPSEVK